MVIQTSITSQAQNRVLATGREIMNVYSDIIIRSIRNSAEDSRGV